MTAKKISVIGLGYIGLPTAAMFATNGYAVAGVDVSQHVVNTLKSGNIHIEEPGLHTIVKAALHSGNLTVSTQLAKSSVFIIAVPTPIQHTKKADMSYVEAATESILPHLEKGNLIILESTSPPGTTEDIICPILLKSGLKPGEDFYVAHCPERVLPGNILKELITNKRIIGGINTRSAEKARELYKSFVEGDIYITDSKVAEMAKIMENTYRDVNIALANELAMICEKLNINVWDVIQYANLHPRVNIHKPGPGVGGHCISVDPWFVIEKAPQESKLIHLARTTNDTMPDYIVNKLIQATGSLENKKITVLGVAYKANVDDTRESPALKIIQQLKAHKAMVALYDPHVKTFHEELSQFEDAFRDSHCILLLVDHDEFKYISPSRLIKLVKAPVIMDTRNSIVTTEWELAGFKVLSYGMPHHHKEACIPL